MTAAPTTPALANDAQRGGHWQQRMVGRIVVAEVKAKSPFGFVNPMPVEKQLRLCETVGDIVSIHTNEWWGGSWAWLALARRMTKKPILAKGFHATSADVQHALDCGADYVLTVGWWNGDERCWHECESLAELAASAAPKAVWNSRNPRTGETRSEKITDARNVRIGWLCQASGIRTPADIGDVEAVLIGQGLYSPNND